MFPFLSYVGRVNDCDDIDFSPCESADKVSCEKALPSRENADVSDDCKIMVNRDGSSRDNSAVEFSKHCDAECVNEEYVRHMYLIGTNVDWL
jgi:hypothetical protein